MSTTRLASLFATMLLLTAAACGGDDDGTPSTPDADPNQPDGGGASADAMPAGPLALNEVFAGDGPTAAYQTDWIEIVNNTANAMDISGYHISDDELSPTKGTFPSGTTLPANGHLRIDVADLEPYPFKLKAGGEGLVLTDDTGVVLDRTTWGDGAAGTETTPVSWGRSPDGTGDFTSLETPTPGEANLPN